MEVVISWLRDFTSSKTTHYVQFNVSNFDILKLSYGRGQWRSYCLLARDFEDRYLMLSNVISKAALGVGHFVSSGSLESNKVLVHYLHSRLRLWCSLLFIASNDWPALLSGGCVPSERSAKLICTSVLVVVPQCDTCARYVWPSNLMLQSTAKRSHARRPCLSTSWSIIWDLMGGSLEVRMFVQLLKWRSPWTKWFLWQLKFAASMIIE